jgi:hypothetical protein
VTVGQYCQYCDHRCFVPDPLKAGWLLATCTEGMAHDRRAAGYDINTARDIVALRDTETQELRLPFTREDRARLVYQLCHRLRGQREEVYLPNDSYVAGEFGWPNTAARAALLDLVASGALAMRGIYHRVLEWDGRVTLATAPTIPVKES